MIHSVRDRYDEVLIESIVADYDESNDGLDGFHRDSCLIVRVGEKTYAVGASARKLLTGNSTGKTLNPDFCTTEHHRALVYAAMASQPSNRIDVLVLGLPVHNFKLYRDRLVEDFTGEHQITDSRKVTVQTVKVCPQPMGGFYDHAERVTYDEVRMARVLIIDPGHNTLDWYYAEGAKPIDTRCGAEPQSGMQSFLTALAKKVADETKKPLSNVSIEDLAIAYRENRPMYVGAAQKS